MNDAEGFLHEGDGWKVRQYLTNRYKANLNSATQKAGTNSTDYRKDTSKLTMFYRHDKYCFLK